ncbi:MAG: flagellar hook protein FlgE [Actinomycetia bacterium]|nr:flagellar hook protein FlgE [Actinomycetes bacterium]
MIRTMYSAVSGLRSHQLMMDVVGNNIANVNTHGYKRNQVIFKDVLSQLVSGAAAPTETLGGTNPAQVGLGVMMSGTAQNFGQGFLQVTNRELDIAIQGDGFFIVDEGGDDLYSRAGALFLDADGRLVSSGGGLIQGWSAGVDGVLDPATPLDYIRVPIGDQNPPIITSEAKFGGNLPSEAAIGEMVYTGLEVFDSQGVAVGLNLTFEKTAVSEWTMTATYGVAQTPIVLTDEVLTFVDGEIVSPADFNVNIAAGQIPGVGDVALTIGGTGERRITQFGDATSLTAVNQNGASAGVLQSVRVGTDGVLAGSYSNGLTKSIAQLALASFANPEGLERVTGSNWRPSVNSGLAQIGTTGTGGRGTIAPGTLEMSNVDLALEFTTLIVSQRGFQANSRVVTAADELLQEIVNLKR